MMIDRTISHILYAIGKASQHRVWKYWCLRCIGSRTLQQLLMMMIKPIGESAGWA